MNHVPNNPSPSPSPNPTHDPNSDLKPNPNLNPKPKPKPNPNPNPTYCRVCRLPGLVLLVTADQFLIREPCGLRSGSGSGSRVKDHLFILTQPQSCTRGGLWVGWQQVQVNCIDDQNRVHQKALRGACWRRSEGLGWSATRERGS